MKNFINKNYFFISEENNHFVWNILFFKVKFKKRVNILEKLDLIQKQQTILIEQQRQVLSEARPVYAKMTLPFLSIHLTDKCNNNCEACSHFCTISDKFFLDLSEYKKNLAVLSQKFQINEIDLMGGEPLLHPNIANIFDITRKILPKTFICLHTNGLLLQSMNNEFWDSCKRNRVAFKITKYPTLKNFSEIIDLCLSNEIFICAIINGNNFLHWMDRSGQGNIHKNFNACKTKFGPCYILRDTRLYTCPTACYMSYYNKYFNQNLPIEKGIDIIYSTDIEILNYLNNPIENCKYCKNVNEIKRLPWKYSQRQVDEWERQE